MMASLHAGIKIAGATSPQPLALITSAICLRSDTIAGNPAANASVWRLFEELNGVAPMFEFLHGRGLGSIIMVPMRLRPFVSFAL